MDRPGRQAKAYQKGRSPTVQNCTSQAKVRDEACLLNSGQTDDNDIPPGPPIPFFLRAMEARSLRRYLLSGERFAAEAAMRIGLVHELYDTDDGDAAV